MVLTTELVCVVCERQGNLLQVTDGACGQLVHLGQCSGDHLVTHHGWRKCEACGGAGGRPVPGDFVPYGEGSVRLPDEWDECPVCEGRGAVL